MKNQCKFIELYADEFKNRIDFNFNIDPLIEIVNKVIKDKRIPLASQEAYILATVKHETAGTFLPIEEYGKGKRRKYGKPTGPYNHIYYGRGYVQLTWLANYERQGKRMGIDLVRYPDMALDPDIAYDILVYGMMKGLFTGKALPEYLNGELTDYIGARRVVNGTDQAQKIANYAVKFARILRETRNQ